ncbi:unnamed protein product [Ambrosiozyma monospora]|uniref:Unnamed protein product n=1 Tax=Ambrosiozyma monospora TaxID=43982 RepID=A0A9W6Z293_AMBMO|nr:unnamed protein product [Ambrosiozyma monospora]
MTENNCKILKNPLKIASSNTMTDNATDHNESFVSVSSRLTPIKDIHNNIEADTEKITDTLRKANNGIALSPGLVNNNYDYLNHLQNQNVFTAGHLSTDPPQPSPSKLQSSTPTSGRSPTRSVHELSNPVRSAYDMFDRQSNATTPTTPSRRHITPIQIKSFSPRSPSILKLHGKKKSKKRSSALSTPNKKQQLQKQNNNSTKLKVLKEILSDPQCIRNITNLIQVLFNATLIVIFLGILLLSLNSIKKDADAKIQARQAESQLRISHCKREYLRNNCDPSLRVPALESKCIQWENCMYSTATSPETGEQESNTSAYFEILADCMNRFFHSLTYKTLFSLSFVCLCCFALPNLLFAKFRSAIDNSYNMHTTNTTSTTNNYYTVNGSANGGGGIEGEPVALIEESSPLRGHQRRHITGSEDSPLRYGQQQQQQQLTLAPNSNSNSNSNVGSIKGSSHQNSPLRSNNQQYTSDLLNNNTTGDDPAAVFLTPKKLSSSLVASQSMMMPPSLQMQPLARSHSQMGSSVPNLIDLSSTSILSTNNNNNNNGILKTPQRQNQNQNSESGLQKTPLTQNQGVISNTPGSAVRFNPNVSYSFYDRLSSEDEQHSKNNSTRSSASKGSNGSKGSKKAGENENAVDWSNFGEELASVTGNGVGDGSKDVEGDSGLGSGWSFATNRDKF